MTRTKTFTAALASMLLAGISTSAFAEAPKKPSSYKLGLSTSYNYSTGDYGQANDTKITYIPVIAKLKYERWTAKLTVPYIRITGPGVVVGGEDTGAVAAPVATATESGLGDVLASLGYTLPMGNAGTFGDLTGKIKIPTADESRNLGTGEIDYTIQAGLTQTIDDLYITGNIGRKFNGSSTRFNLDDVWKYSIGTGYNFTPEANAGVTYDFRQSATDTGKNFSQATVHASYKLTEDWATQIYAGTGFTDAAPDLSTGFQLSYKFSPFRFSPFGG